MKLCYFKQTPIAGEVCGSAAQAIAKRGKRHRYREGDFIFTPYADREDAVYLLEEGRVVVYESVEGRRVVLDTLCPGDLFGDFRPYPPSTSLLSGFAQAQKDAIVVQIPQSGFLDILREFPEASLCFIQLLSEKLQIQQARMRDLAVANAERRVLNELIREGTQKDDGTIFVVRKTHESLAQRLGLSRETVTKTLRQLRSRGAIALDAKRNIAVKGPKE